MTRCLVPGICDFKALSSTTKASSPTDVVCEAVQVGLLEHRCIRSRTEEQQQQEWNQLRPSRWSKSSCRSTSQFASKRPVSHRTMNYSTCMTISLPKYPYGGKSKISAHRNEERIGSRPSFASRMVKLIFRRSSADPRAKSWPGREEPVPVPVVVPTSADRQSSANIVIPNSLSSSAPAVMLGSRRTRSMRTHKHSAVRVGCNAEWRHRQAHCANCERLFFTSLSALSSSAGRFCSLDCKANFEYVSLLQETMDAGFDGISSYSFDSSLEGDDDD